MKKLLRSLDNIWFAIRLTLSRFVGFLFYVLNAAFEGETFSEKRHGSFARYRKMMRNRNIAAIIILLTVFPCWVATGYFLIKDYKLFSWFDASVLGEVASSIILLVYILLALFVCSFWSYDLEKWLNKKFLKNG